MIIDVAASDDAAIDEFIAHGMPYASMGDNHGNARRGIAQVVPIASEDGHYDETQAAILTHNMAHAYSLDDAAGVNLAPSWLETGSREELTRTVSNFELGFDVGLQLDWYRLRTTSRNG